MGVVAVASNNKHKIEELSEILSACLEAEFVPASSLVSYPEPEETGLEFATNAMIKAEAAFKACGTAVITDDSGLMVELLDGAPGVFSARYAGVHGDDQANNRKLVDELEALSAFESDGRPRACFMSVIAYIDERGNRYIAQGRCDGYIVAHARGDQGFGYDPHFVPDCSGGKTMAELSAEEKNAISHRRAAIEDLLVQLQARPR